MKAYLSLWNYDFSYNILICSLRSVSIDCLTNRIEGVYTGLMPEQGLYEEKRVYQTARFWRWILLLTFLIGSVLAFKPELLALLRSGQSWLSDQEGLDVILTHPEIKILGINFLAFLVFFVGGLLIVSQFVLPVQRIDERGKAFNRILRYLFRRHGAAIFIREAQVIGQAEEIESSYPGVAFVDLCSAIALEDQLVVTSRSKASEPGGIDTQSAARGRISPFFRRQRTAGRSRPVRVAGPGLVFTERREKLRGVADMRKQFRLVPNASIATRDGFSVLSNVFIIFSLGDAPEVLKVTCLGDTPADIQSVQVDPWTRKVTGFKDELDDADKAEIYQFMETYQPETFEAFDPPDAETPIYSAPYHYDLERIFSAIYSDSKNVSNDSIEPWTNLPEKVAVDVFRDMLSLQKFDELYRPHEPYQDQREHTFPFLGSFRPEFNRRMRNLGVLAFQAGRRLDAKPLEIGDRWDVEDLELFPERRLRNSKVLRDRGIRVIASGFPELNPSHPGVRKQLIDYWSARWKRDAGQMEAEHTLAAMREQTRVRAQAHRDMVEALRRIFSDQPLSQEAIALRLMQALESMAGDPLTEKILPKDALAFLKELRGFLFSESQGGSKP